MWERKTRQNLTSNREECAREERERDQVRLGSPSHFFSSSSSSSSPPISGRPETKGDFRKERKRLNPKVRTEFRQELRGLRRQARDRNESLAVRTRLTFAELLRDVEACQPMYKFVRRNNLRCVCGIISAGRESDVYCVAGRPTTATSQVSKEVGVDAGQGGEREDEEDGSKGIKEEDERAEQAKVRGKEDDTSLRTWNLYAMKVYKKTAPILTFNEARARPVHGDHRDHRAHPRYVKHTRFLQSWTFSRRGSNTSDQHSHRGTPQRLTALIGIERV